jgi:hypothetical protein
MSAPEFPRNASSDSSHAWTPKGADRAGDAPASALHRFLGGPPVAVFVRLLFVSLVVGALLVWLNIHPYDLVFWVQRIFHRLWMLGWDAVREVLEYVLAGAAIVIPVWLLMRLFNMRGAS